MKSATRTSRTSFETGNSSKIRCDGGTTGPFSDSTGSSRTGSRPGDPLRDMARPGGTATMRLAVIGAGEMGHGIAELAALHGHEVRMRDVKQEFLDRGMERIRWSLGKLVEKNQIRPDQMQEAIDRIRTTLDLAEACNNADVAIEAVFEDLELKRRVFQELDAAAPKKTILASNTSALPITKMAL